MSFQLEHFQLYYFSWTAPVITLLSPKNVYDIYIVQCLRPWISFSVFESSVNVTYEKSEKNYMSNGKLVNLIQWLLEIWPYDPCKWHKAI